jgi:ribosomal protein S18 acetylase RimI-like enzyme
VEALAQLETFRHFVVAKGCVMISDLRASDRFNDLASAHPECVGYIGQMQNGDLSIVRCPPHRLAEAISLVLVDVAPSQRRAIATAIAHFDDAAELANEPLFVAFNDKQFYGASWGQRQSGNYAVFWPPQLVNGYDEATARRLAEAVVRSLDETVVEMTQVLISDAQSDSIGVLEHVGFRHLADLLYLTCEAHRFPTKSVSEAHIDFVPYSGPLRSRLMQLIERTYEQTLDCTALNGVRDVDSVINGYQSTGVFNPQNWMIVRANSEDVGVLLLADHPTAGHWELMYMGLVPEVRGKHWGQQITQHAQWLAGKAGVERIVLAVDSTNLPALRMYRSTGFEIWDKRTVFVRFPGGRAQPNTQSA